MIVLSQLQMITLRVFFNFVVIEIQIYILYQQYINQLAT